MPWDNSPEKRRADAKTYGSPGERLHKYASHATSASHIAMI